MDWVDFVNSGFEFATAVFMYLHCRTLYRDKKTKGVNINSIMFFFTLSMWNLYFYRDVEQSLSWYAAILVFITNFFYTGMAVYYGRRKHNNTDPG